MDVLFGLFGFSWESFYVFCGVRFWKVDEGFCWVELIEEMVCCCCFFWRGVMVVFEWVYCC